MDSAVMATLLAEFGLKLTLPQLEQLSRYLDLLRHWNRAINLTAIDDPDEVVRRHFAESLYLTRFVSLRGALLDVGSGAGFPGLPIKIVVPELHVLLLEPVTKKRAFLKEVVRECGLTGVEVSGDRVQVACVSHQGQFEAVTARAVGGFTTVLPAIAKCLATGDASVFLWLTKAEATRLAADFSEFQGLFSWTEPISIPFSRDREIWCGNARRREVIES